MEHSEIKNSVVERVAKYGIILEKSYTIDIAYDYLKEHKRVKNLQKAFYPTWGEHVLYLDYDDKNIVILSAKGSPIAVNAVERIRRNGGEFIVLIGTCGSTNESIIDGTFVLALSGVRDEGVSSGYLDIKVPAMSDIELTAKLKSNCAKLGCEVLTGVAFTTDKRYRENPDELKILNKRAGVIYVDMETSAVLLVSRYYGIKATALKIVTDCAVKHTIGDKKGGF